MHAWAFSLASCAYSNESALLGLWRPFSTGASSPSTSISELELHRVDRPALEHSRGFLQPREPLAEVEDSIFGCHRAGIMGGRLGASGDQSRQASGGEDRREAVVVGVLGERPPVACLRNRTALFGVA